MTRFAGIASTFLVRSLLLCSVLMPGVGMAVQTDIRPKVSLTEAERAWLKTHPEVILGTEMDWYPYVLTNEDGSISGIEAEFIQRINQLTGANIRLVLGKWPDMLDKAQKREIDGLAVSAYHKEREPYFLFTDSTYTSSKYIYAASSRDYKLTELADLVGKKVALLKGNLTERELLWQTPGIIYVTVDSYEKMISLLLRGEVDAVIGSVSFRFALQEREISSLELAFIVSDSETDMRYSVRKDWPELQGIINKALAAIPLGERQLILQKWWHKKPQSSGSTSFRDLLSKEETAWLDQKHVVRVRIGDHPPWNYISPVPGGMAVEYLKWIGDKYGINFQYIPDEKPWIEGFKDIAGQHLRFDLYPQANRTPERLEHLAMSDDYLQSPWVVFTRDDVSDVYEVGDLKNKKIAVERGFVMYDKLKSLLPEAEFVVREREEDVLLALSAYEADAYVGNLIITSFLMERLGMTNIKVACPTPFGMHSQAMATRKEWAPLISIINKGLSSMPAPEKHAIRNKYSVIKYEHGISGDKVKKWVLITALSALSIITVFLVWNKQLSRRVAQRTAELSESEARFRATFEQAAVGIAHVSPDGRFLRLNQKFCEIVGYSEKEVLKLKFQDITHPDDLDADLHLFQELLDGKSDSYTMEKRYIRKDGSLVWISLTVKILRNEDGSPRWFVSVIEDISDRIRIQDEVHKSYEFLNHLTKTIPDAIFSVKLPERTVTWCTDTYGVLGYEAQECIGESTEKLYPSHVEVEKMGALIDNAINNENETVQAEIMLRRKNGEIFPVEAKLAFQKEDDRVVSVTALLRDISERKLVEKKLQESHDYLKHLVSSIPDAVFRVKLPERVIDWVEDYSHIMGASDVKEMYGQPTRNYFASEDEYNAFGEIQRQTIENGKDFMRHEIIVRRSDGKTFPAEVTSSFFRENGTVKYVTALVRDITDRKEAEKKILDYQKHLKALASQLTLAEERERRRIAADLHDDIGQTLAMSRLQLAAAIRACDCTGSKHHGMLEEISATLLKAIQDTRQLIFELGSAAIHEIGIGAAIAEWIDEKMKSLDDEIDFDLVDNLADNMLEEDQRVILFRNIRELLTNTIKHARASKVEILLESDDHEINITVQDDGIGFNPELISGEFNQEGGYGIFSIEERMADLGGRLKIDSAPHKGCSITMSLPIES